MNEPEDVRLHELAAEGVKRALSQGADAAEVFLLETRTTSFIALGEYASPHETLQEGVCVRVALGGRVGQAGSTGLHTLDDVVRDALAGARGLRTGSRALDLAPALPAVPQSLVDPTLASGDADRMSSAVERVSQRLRAARDVTYARASLLSSRRRFALANSEGLEVEQENANELLELEVRVTRGSADRSAFDSCSSVRPVETRLDLEAMADTAVEQARAALDAQPLPNGAVDEVILTGGPASQLIGIFASALSGLALEAGKSALADRVGERVVSDLLTLEDRPLDDGGRNRRALDDEGTPTRDTLLVEHGVLREFLHTRASAHALGVEPTGNGIRKDVQSSVLARPINLHVRPGDASLDELVQGARRAVLVNQPLLGAFVASRVTGDFSLVAPFAFYVEDGRIRHALPPTTVGGNVQRVLEEVRAVGRDPRTFRAGTVPSLRAGGVSCAT